jgi:phosphoglycolate phosphatase
MCARKPGKQVELEKHYRQTVEYEPVLCDFDGTLANSTPVIVRAIEMACNEVGVTIPPDADLRTCVGPPLERALPAIFGVDAPVEELIDSYRRHYIRTAPTQTVLMPNALATIESWHRTGIRIGVVSYKPLPVLKTVVQGLGLDRYLSVIRAPDIGKPPPSKNGLLREAVNALLPLRGKPLFIGDHHDDELAARDAGVDFIPYPKHSWLDIRRKVSGS